MFNITLSAFIIDSPQLPTTCLYKYKNILSLLAPTGRQHPISPRLEFMVFTTNEILLLSAASYSYPGSVIPNAEIVIYLFEAVY